ncbi:hypothetical protein HYW87_01980 [Candidatus Roizmanbacteria bacterium]|nr:hypothetical protein [Candidatus Roizmanbacteria bacterium]
MRKFLAALFLAFFLFFLFTPQSFAQLTPTSSPSISPSAGGIDLQKEIDKLLQQQGKGRIGERCATSGFLVGSWQITNPVAIPVLQQAIDIIISPINLILGLFDGIRYFIYELSKNVFQIPPCAEGEASNPKDLANCVCVKPDDFNVARLCQGIKSDNEIKECVSCSSHGVWTALGCIDFNLSVAIKDRVFGLGIGIAGIIALLCIIYAAFTLQTSRGNPEKLKRAQEMLTSCIMGLMLIIFSVFILRLIGVDILRIPGFS